MKPRSAMLMSGGPIAHLLGLSIASKGPLLGRVMSEALPDGKAPTVTAQTVRSPAANGLSTVLIKPFAAGDRTV